jgi:hypothetical protein
MKQTMKIKGTLRIGDKVRLFLMFDDVVKKSSKMSLMETIGMARDIGAMEKMQEEIQQQALLMQQPDCVTIPYEDWKKYQYKVDDIIWIEITSDEKMER